MAEKYVVSRRSPEFFDAAFESDEGREKVTEDGEYETLTGAVVEVHKFDDGEAAVAFSLVTNGTVYDSEFDARRHARQIAEGQ